MVYRGGKYPSKYGSYQVSVTIIEAKHLAQNGNPMIVVKVGNHKKKTGVRERTDCPYYNEYFVFNFTCHFDELLTMRITISAYLRNRLRQLKFYGGMFFEIGTVWDQPNHEYYHKWAMLTNPKDPSAGPKGYVKCNITVTAKGEKLKAHPETDGDEDIEGLVRYTQDLHEN